jgi:hypothetical protein
MSLRKGFTRTVAIQVSLLAVVGLAVGALCIRDVRAEASKPQPVAGGVWLVVTHKVEDYARWRPVHDHTATIKRSYGWTKSSVFALDGDRNHVMVMEQFDALDRAKAFAYSSELRDEMAASGVASEPEVHFVSMLSGEQL